MADKYTPGALSIFVDSRLPNEVNLMSGKLYVAYMVAGAEPDTLPSEDSGLNNARRLVACWNACEGLETADIEANGVASAAEVQQLVKRLTEAEYKLRDVTS
jgi:hypothetical protein